MDFFDVIKARRSIRKFTAEAVPSEVMEKAFAAATLAPNSSNAQTWNFYWIKDPAKKAKMVELCLSQSAARTCQEIVVAVASPKDWKRSWPYLKKFVDEVNAPKLVKIYYQKLFPLMYTSGPLNTIGLFKMVSSFVVGLVRPMSRNATTSNEIKIVCVKSVALACENFVLAISAQGFSTCMMEGIDSFRIKKLLKLRCSDSVVMCIAVGKEAERGTWGPSMRIPQEQVIHIV